MWSNRTRTSPPPADIYCKCRSCSDAVTVSMPPPAVLLSTSESCETFQMYPGKASNSIKTAPWQGGGGASHVISNFKNCQNIFTRPWLLSDFVILLISRSAVLPTDHTRAERCTRALCCTPVYSTTLPDSRGNPGTPKGYGCPVQGTTQTWPAAEC